MELTNLQRAETIVHALPYIQKYYNKVVVIKYGGNAMINEDLKKAVMNDIVLLSLIGVKVVLVHGGGPEINSMLNKIGKKSEFVNETSCYRRGNNRYGAYGACRKGK